MAKKVHEVAAEVIGSGAGDRVHRQLATRKATSMPLTKVNWVPNDELAVGKGATIQQFLATVGGNRFEINVAPWGGMLGVHFRGGAVHAGRIHGGVRPTHPIAGRPGYPIAGRPGRPIAGYPGGYYPGRGYRGAAYGAAVGAAAAGAYGYFGNYYNNCNYDTYGNWVCPQQYQYPY